MNPTMKPTIEISNLSTGYQSKKRTKIVAKDISAQISCGELTCLLGTNGVGKSTLMKTLCHFLPRLGGDIAIMGKPLEDYTDASLAKVISVVLTDKLMIRNMRVDELVALGRSPYTGFWGVISDKDREIVHRSLKQVGIPHLAGRMLHTLSDGERQKALIAKALAQETPIILLDEPTAFLDFPSKVEMMQLLHRLSRDEQKTIFMSTHDLELALQIADKLWLLDKEKAVQIGTPEDLAIHNVLHRFVTHEGISFDADSGLFRVVYRFHSHVEVIGEGVAYQMLCKGLHRHGITTQKIEDTQATDISIICREGDTIQYEISHKDNNKQIVASVEHALLAIESSLQ